MGLGRVALWVGAAVCLVVVSRLILDAEALPGAFRVLLVAGLVAFTALALLDSRLRPERPGKAPAPRTSRSLAAAVAGRQARPVRPKRVPASLRVKPKRQAKAAFIRVRPADGRRATATWKVPGPPATPGPGRPPPPP